MPLENTFAPMRQKGKWEKTGIGLVGVDQQGKIRTVLQAVESERRLPFLTDHLLSVHFGLSPASERTRPRRTWVRQSASRTPRG
jgi:hypothetical protein